LHSIRATLYTITALFISAVVFADNLITVNVTATNAVSLNLYSVDSEGKGLLVDSSTTSTLIYTTTGVVANFIKPLQANAGDLAATVRS